jgi:hypothetical protein
MSNSLNIKICPSISQGIFRLIGLRKHQALKVRPLINADFSGFVFGRAYSARQLPGEESYWYFKLLTGIRK